MTVIASRTVLTSPAVLRENHPDHVELVFVGRVARPDGTPVRGAVLELRGVSLHTDEHGTFELLLEWPVAPPDHLPVTVTGPGVAAASHRVPVSDLGRLADGTIVVLHDFTVEAKVA